MVTQVSNLQLDFDGVHNTKSKKKDNSCALVNGEVSLPSLLSSGPFVRVF